MAEGLWRKPTWCGSLPLALALCWLAAPLRGAPRPRPPSPVGEQRRLRHLRAERFRACKALVLDRTADDGPRLIVFGKIGGLLDQPGALALVQQVYDEPFGGNRKTSKWRLRLPIIEMLGAWGGPDAVPLLLRATRDKSPDLRWRALTALAAVSGKGAIPRLQQMRLDPESTVALRARLELVKLGDKAATDDVLRGLKPAALGPEEREHAQLAMSQASEANLQAAVPLLVALCGRLDWRRDEALLDAWMSAVATLSSLAPRKAVPLFIEGLGLTPEQLEGASFDPLRALKRDTGKDFGRDRAKWAEWWARDGHKVRFPHPLRDEKVRAAAARRVLEWATSKESGPLLGGPVLYLDENGLPAGAAPKGARTYSSYDLLLLEVDFLSLERFVQQGDRVFVHVRPTRREHSLVGEHLPVRCVELEKQGLLWKVVAVTRRAN